MKCQAVSYVQILSRNTLQLKLLEHPPVSVGAGAPIVINAPDDEVEPDASAVTLHVQKPAGSSTPLAAQALEDEKTSHRGWTRRIGLGVLAVVATAGLLGVGRFLLGHAGSSSDSGSMPRTAPIRDAVRQMPAVVPVGPSPVEIHIAYGTEKQKWLEEATAEFARTPAGSRIRVILHGMGSVEGALAVLDGPSPVPIHVWSPASCCLPRSFRAGMACQPQEQPDREGRQPGADADGLCNVARPA